MNRREPGHPWFAHRHNLGGLDRTVREPIRDLAPSLRDPSVIRGLISTGGAESCTVPDMAKTVPLTEARAKLSELLDELESRHEHVVITRNGRPTAVLVPADEQEALEETLEILQDEDILEALRESEEDVKAGRLRTLREVRREIGLA